MSAEGPEAGGREASAGQATTRPEPADRIPKPGGVPGSMVRSLDRFFRRQFPRIGYWFGVLAAVWFWVTVYIDGYESRRWWVFTNSSFSALGDPTSGGGANVSFYYFYNLVVLTPTAIFVLVFATAMVVAARNRIEVTGSAFFFQAGVWLELIAVFHGGFGYDQIHDFVSTGFFVWAAVSIVTWGLGLLLERWWIPGLWMAIAPIVALAIFDPLVSAFHWSVAEGEAYGVVLIDVFLAIMYFTRNPKPRTEPQAVPS